MMAGDDLRSGWYPDQPALDPTTVGSPYFGQIFNAKVDGQIYAQPLYANGTLFVATESNWVYALDPATGTPLWSRRLATPWYATDVNCGDLLPTIGVTGTPAIDVATGTAYMISKTYATGLSGPAAWYAHAIALATGDERPGFPVEIAGSASNQPDQVFDPTRQMQRPGLLLMNGTIYAAFGAHCDAGTYYGWIAAISTDGILKTMWTTEAGPGHTKGGGIWQAGGALISDGAGQILFATGNDWTAPTTPVPGHTPPGALGESIVRVSVQEDETLAASDFFTPTEILDLNNSDGDIGSGAPVGLPSTMGTKTHPNLLVQVGKMGIVYVLDRDDLGGFRTGANAGDRVLQRLGPYGGAWSKPSVWPGDGGYLYVPVVNGCTDSTDTNGCLRAFQVGASGDGTPTLAAVGTSKDAFGYGSSAVVVTSDGTRSGSALLWSTWSSGWDGTGSQLRAYDAVPTNGKLAPRFVAGIGQAAKFTAPAVGDGRIYVGTRDGHLLGFGINGAPPLHAEGVAFAPTLVDTDASSEVHLTASTAVQILGLGLSGDFALAPTAPAETTRLETGDLLVLPIVFHPPVEGPIAGSLQITTDRGTFSIPLSGVGLSATPKLVASPATLSFPPAVMGTTSTRTITFTNVSATPVVISGVMEPVAPFAAAGVPVAGTVVASQGTFSVTISFAPTTSGSSAGFFSLVASGAVAAIAIEGAGLVGGRLVLAPAALDFGPVMIGDAATATLELRNDGDAPVIIEKSKPPTNAAFAVAVPFGEGTVIPPHGSITQTIVAAPTSIDASEDVWQINADDGLGLRLFTMRVSGQQRPTATPVVNAAAAPSGADDTSFVEPLPPSGCSAAGGSAPRPGAPFGLLLAAAVILRTSRRPRR